MSKLGKWELWLRGLGKITARSGCVAVCPNQGPQWPTWAGPCFSLRLTLSLQRAVEPLSSWERSLQLRTLGAWVTEPLLSTTIVWPVPSAVAQIRATCQLFLLRCCVSLWRAPPSSSGSIYEFRRKKIHIFWVLPLGRCSLTECFLCYCSLRPNLWGSWPGSHGELGRSGFFSPRQWGSLMHSF